jgi:hypothetical protein
MTRPLDPARVAFRDRVIARRDELLKDVRTLEGKIAGIEMAIELLEAYDDKDEEEDLSVHSHRGVLSDRASER